MLELLGRTLTGPFYRNPVLIVGTGRSGTSVLLQALGQHPDIYSLPGEAPFLTTIGGSAFLFEEADNAAYYLDAIKVPKTHLFDELRRIGYETAAGRHYGLKRLLKGFAGRAPSPIGRRYWCAKTFPSEKVTKGLLSLYPRARFIYIVRNGCDVVQSRTKFRGFTHQDFRQHCRNWAEGVEKYRHLTLIPQALLVHQEKLKSDQAAFFSEIAKFLEIQDRPEPADFALSTVVHPLDQSDQFGSGAVEQLKRRASAYGQWSDQERSIFKDLCNAGMRELGYEMPF